MHPAINSFCSVYVCVCVYIYIYIYVVIYHCSTVLVGKQIMNIVITMTNNKQGSLLLPLMEINQPEDAFPPPPPTPRR